MTSGRLGGAVALPRPSRIDYDGLAATLAAIGYPVRLELLDSLRVAQALTEIRLAPRRTPPGSNPDRVVSKQAVHTHVDKLVAVGLVDVENLVQGGRRVNRYVVNLAQFWSTMEALRRLATRFAGYNSGQQTGTMVAAAIEQEIAGPRLVIVHGAYEGRTFPLSKSAPGGWVIGRARSAQVCLDYDRFVSSEHALVTPTDAGFVIEDKGKNGTRINWVPLPKGGQRLLRAGDVIGVGQTLLVVAQ